MYMCTNSKQTYTYTSIYRYRDTYTYYSAWADPNICPYTYKYIYIHINIYTHILVYIYTHIHVHIHVHIDIVLLLAWSSSKTEQHVEAKGLGSRAVVCPERKTSPGQNFCRPESRDLNLDSKRSAAFKAMTCNKPVIQKSHSRTSRFVTRSAGGLGSHRATEAKVRSSTMRSDAKSSS